jgi:uncharacterized Zn finger protein (UPF0148 family)
MTYNYCPNCGKPLILCYDSVTGESHCYECGEVLPVEVYHKPKPDPNKSRFADDDIVEQRIYPELRPVLKSGRLAGLREKYNKDFAVLPTAAALARRLDQATRDINEVLDGLEECERKRTHELAMYELRRGAAINRVASNLPSQFGSPESEDLKPECSERAPAEQPFFVVKDGRIVGEFARDAKMIQDWENWKADGRGWRR